MTENERQRKAKRLIEGIETLRLACKQLDIVALEYEQLIIAEERSGEVHNSGSAAEPKRTV